MDVDAVEEGAGEFLEVFVADLGVVGVVAGGSGVHGGDEHEAGGEFDGAVDAGDGDFAAFEGLVGSHGGLGGWQDRGLFIPPTQLVSEAAEIRGAEELHAQLVSMQVRLGHRSQLPGSVGTAYP